MQKFFQTSLEPLELDKVIEACKRNNAAAQEKLYKHFFALMFSICKSYSPDQATTLSLINEGFLKVFSNIQHFDDTKGIFESWAKRIVTNTCIDYARRQKKEECIVDFENAELQENRLQHLPKTYANEEVLYLIKRLPVVTQKVFSLYIFDGYTYKEIAEMMNIAESTSRWHVGEARKNLRKQVNKIF